MTRIWKITRVLLEIWGVLCLIGLFMFIPILDWAGLSRARTDFADRDDVAVFMNRSDLGGRAQVVEVLNSYRSTRNITNDHVDAYRITVDEFPEEYVLNVEPEVVRWRVGPVENQLLKDAIWNACAFSEGEGLDWFPSVAEMNSERFLLKFIQLRAHDLIVDKVQLAAWDREEEVLYFSDVSW